MKTPPYFWLGARAEWPIAPKPVPLPEEAAALRFTIAEPVNDE